ncbi:MAG: proline/glycine betaine ABC transporter permease [Pelovirga sp.]
MNLLSFKEKLIPLDEWVQTFVDWLVFNHRDVFQAIKAPIEISLKAFEWFFTVLPPLAVILLFVVIAWRVAGKRVALFSLVTLLLVGYLGLWEETMTTLAMVISSVFFCALAGIPLGILAGRSDRFELFLRPVLDAMQTIPPFVYLVPVVMLFSIGTVSGILATIIFALPPIVRLTSLGIRQVHPELIEAALAFGATSWQVLRKVQFPLALPSIMAGLNQTLMMALSMVVIAALIGAGGLGNPVVQGLNTLEIGLATIGGLAIVLLAMMLDRITQGFAARK